MFSNSFFLSPFPSSSVFLTCFAVTHLCLSGMHRTLSLTHNLLTSISHSHIMLHHVLYPLHVLCDIERSGSLNACSLMGDYWCRVLIPLTHQNQTCSSVSKKCVHVIRFQGTQFYDKEEMCTHKTNTHKKSDLPIAVKEGSCVTVQWLGQGQWYSSFI